MLQNGLTIAKDKDNEQMSSDDEFEDGEEKSQDHEDCFVNNKEIE